MEKIKSDVKSRNRVGVLVPSSNTVMENDLHNHLSKELYTVHTARMYLEKTTPEAEKVMMEEYSEPAAQQLKTLFPNLLVFGCTSASSLFGQDYDEQLTSKLGEITGSKCVGVLDCVRNSLKNRNINRIAVFTPYIDSINRTIKESLELTGLEVVNIKGMQIDNNFKIAEVSPDEIIEFVNKNFSDKVDAIFISCTNYRSLEVRSDLEGIHSLPVITSNFAVLEYIKNYFDETK